MGNAKEPGTAKATGVAPIRVIVDSREPPLIARHLAERGVVVERRTISPADFVVSGECAVERKTVSDFMSSLFSGRLFEQVSALRETYQRPMVIVEGDVGQQLERRRNPRAYWGAVMKIQAEMGIPIVATPTASHTADALYILAKRLQCERHGHFVAHNKPRLMSPEDWRLFIIASLPSIGDELASRLLAHFRSVRRIFLADRSQLQEVEGIGEAKARRICELLDEEF